MAAGDVLAGRYGLRRRLDVLFGAERWLAEDDTLARPVEICAMPPDHPRAEAVLDAARQASSVADQRLVRVLDVGTDDGCTYVVTEWVDGDTLTELVRHGPLAADQARTLVGETALALEQARHRGLHHLLLSSDNVLRLDDGSVKVAGLAVDAALAGLETSDPDAASRQDTFGLVAIAYAALTGFWPKGTTRHPHGPDNHDESGLADSGLPPAPGVGGAPVAPAQIVSGVPADLDTLCVQAFAAGKAPDTPGDLAGQIAPWGDRVRQQRSTGAFPLTLPPLRRDAEPDGDAPRTGPRTPPPALPHAPVPASAPPKSAPSKAAPPAAPAPQPAPATAAPASTSSASLPPATTPLAAGAPAAQAPQAPGATTPPAPAPPNPATAALPTFTQDDPGWDGLFDELPREQPAPLLPPTPLTRPPGRQTRTVLILVGVFVLIMLGLAKCGLSGLGDNAFVHKTTSRPTPSAPTSQATQGATTGTTTPAETDTTPAPVAIRAAHSFDPQGDGQEKEPLASKAIDGDPGTAWTSDAYKSATFSGLKKGVGLRLDLGGDTAVHQVTLTLPLSGTDVEIRTISGGATSLAGSQVIASANDAGSTVTLTPDQPVTTRYLLVWFTKAVADKDGYRVGLSEVSVS